MVHFSIGTNNRVHEFDGNDRSTCTNIELEMNRSGFRCAKQEKIIVARIVPRENAYAGACTRIAAASTDLVCGRRYLFPLCRTRVISGLPGFLLNSWK